MPSPIESPRRTPLKASLLLRQTPALTVSVNKIMFRVNLTVPLRLFRTKTKPLLLGCFVFVRGFAASGDKVVALLRLDLTHLPPMRITLREKSPPISPQSAPYPVRYTLVYIVTAVFYGEGFICYSPSRKI